MKTIRIEQISLELSPFVRAGVSDETIEDYASVYRSGKTLPEPVVFIDEHGGVLLADGRHRLEAATRAGLTEIKCEVMRGGYEDALRFACASNVEHGLRRTNADKRACVAAALKQWPNQSDRQLGELCAVDHKTVGCVRGQIGGEIPNTKNNMVGTKHENEDKQMPARLIRSAPVEMWQPPPPPEPTPTTAMPKAVVPVALYNEVHAICNYANRIMNKELTLVHSEGFRHLVTMLKKLEAYLQIDLPGILDQVPVKGKARGSMQEVVAFVVGIGLDKSDAEWFFWKCEGCGWKNDGKPILDWQATCRAWDRAKIFPSQKQKVALNGQPAPKRSWMDKEMSRLKKEGLL